LAIHLDRDVNDKGLLLNRQTHLRPLWATEGGDVLAMLDVGVDETFDVVLFDTTPARYVGVDGDFIASGRIDNLVSCWAGVDALRRHVAPRPMILCLFDHEEVGSESTTGAAGPMLENILAELLRVRGLTDERFAFLRHSLCISADNAHGLHPNYPERHDPNHAPLVNRGPALKRNANQRYATSANGASIMRRVAREAGVHLQDFVSNNSMPCGSTIGPITATRLGIETIDIGVPQLAMHSARETCGARDPSALRDLIVAASTANY
jgi:aspartyl aminopeptidase